MAAPPGASGRPQQKATTGSGSVDVSTDGRRRAGLDAAAVFYSRYADDLTFSFDSDEHAAVQRIIWMTQQIVADEGYRLHTRKKLRIMRRHDRQLVTGLVVNTTVQLPRARRRWLRAVEHHAATGRPTTLTPTQVRGWRALQHMVAMQTAGPG